MSRAMLLASSDCRSDLDLSLRLPEVGGKMMRDFEMHRSLPCSLRLIAISLLGPYDGVLWKKNGGSR